MWASLCNLLAINGVTHPVSVGTPRMVAHLVLGFYKPTEVSSDGVCRVQFSIFSIIARPNKIVTFNEAYIKKLQYLFILVLRKVYIARKTRLWTRHYTLLTKYEIKIEIQSVTAISIAQANVSDQPNARQRERIIINKERDI